MSIGAVVSRVAQLQQLMDTQPGSPAGANFADSLASAGQASAAASLAGSAAAAGALGADSPLAGGTAIGVGSPLAGATGLGTANALAGTTGLGTANALAGATGLGTGSALAAGNLIGVGNPLAGATAAGVGTGLPAATMIGAGNALGGATAIGAGAPASGASSLPAGTPFGAEITAAARRNGIDPALLAGLIKQESGFNPNAGSPAGAQGLTQLMPGTARGLGVSNTLDPVQSIEGGAKYLRQQLDTFGGDVARALAAYNAGPGAVQRYGGVPPYAETQNYVRKVQAYAASFRSSSSSTI